jgi:hypothetical protein
MVAAAIEPKFEIRNIEIAWEDDHDADTSFLEDDQLEEYENGEAYFQSCRAVAEIGLFESNDGRYGHWQTQTITSGGLYGIHFLHSLDDHKDTKSYRREVEAEELSDLRTQLIAMGIDVEGWI